MALGAALTVVLGVGFTAITADASQNPAGCNENDFILQIKQDPGPPFTVGDTINYSVRSGNTDPSAPGCDIDGVTVTLTTPDGVVHTQQTGGSYPFPTAVSQTGPTVPYVANLADAVAGPCGDVLVCPVIIATAKATGLLHDDPIQDDPFTVIKQVSGTISAPPQSHFLCYELRRTPPTIGNVNVVDQFGTNTVKVAQMHELCTPTNKNNEDPTAPSRPGHLTGYDATSTGNPANNKKIEFTNQFGTRTATLKAVASVMVPASKSLVAPPAPLNPVQVDPYVCYNVADPPFVKIRNVVVQDQFGGTQIDILGVRWFCDPANVNGGEPAAPGHPGHLACYSIAQSSGFNFTPPGSVFVKNKFEAKKISLDGHINIFCVPSTKKVLP